MKKIKILMLLMASGMLQTACTSEQAAEQNKEKETELHKTTFVGGIYEKPAKSRTSIEINYGSSPDVNYFWEPGDKIWTADGSSAKALVTAKAATARFILPKRYNTSTVELYCPGKNATAYNQVTIPTTQTQTVPNSTTHLGESGDCGTATAQKQPDDSYIFNLDHKAAILCFLPRNEYSLKATVVKSIKVTSNNNIAGDFILSSAGLTGAGSSKTITLQLNDFPLTNTTTSQTTNAAYMVIKPGTHSFNIEYEIYDTRTKIGTTITKSVSGTYAENTVAAITAHLAVNDYTQERNYMWDAAEGEYYWKGVSDIPFFDEMQGGENKPGYPTASTDSRWYNAAAYQARAEATRSCKDAINVNQLLCYIFSGDPYYDENTVWSKDGYLRKRGIWFKKHNYIAGFSDVTSPKGDFRNQYTYTIMDTNTKLGTPPAATLYQYFFLPNVDTYLNGTSYGGGQGCCYWTKSPIRVSGGGAVDAGVWCFVFYAGRARTFGYPVSWGYPVFKLQ